MKAGDGRIVHLQSAEERAEIRRARRAARTPAEREAEARAHQANLERILSRYRKCEACGIEKAGPLHRTSVALWTHRAERARSNGAADPVSGVTPEDAERHLMAIAAA